MRTLFFTLALSFPLLAFSQFQRQQDIFPKFGNYERKGWIISPSVNYTLGAFKENKERVFPGSDTIYDVLYDPKGKLGVGFEAGRFYAIDNSRFISFVDFSLGVKIIKGAEKMEATLAEPNSNNFSKDAESLFSLNYATASFNATNIIHISDKYFIGNALGVNADYAFSQNFEYDNADLPSNPNYPANFVFQAHYKLSFGTILTDNIMIIPSVETPIMTFYEYDDLKSTLSVFNSRYRPLIFRLEIMILDGKANIKCPPGNRKRKNKENLFGMAGKRPW